MKKINLFSRLWSSGGNSQRNDSRHDSRRSDLRRSPSGFGSKSLLKFVSVLTLIFTLGILTAWGETLTCTFESVAGKSFPYNDAWTLTAGTENTTYHHGGSRCVTLNSASFNIVTAQKINGTVTNVTYYAGRTTKNSTATNVYIQTSTDGSTWTTQNTYAISGAGRVDQSNDNWSTVSQNMSVANCYVRITRIGGGSSTAVRAIDDIIITYTPSATCSSPPTVGASGNSSISVTGATVSCTGITKGDCDIDEWGFFYKTGSSGVTTSDTKVQVSAAKSTTDVSSFNKSFTELNPNTHYYFKAYAKVGSDYYLSSETDFTTKTLTGSSSNTTYGTVSRSGRVITGSLKAGGTYGSPAYTVTGASGGSTTTVEREGNRFTVTSNSTSNITVTINFESKGCTDHGASSITSGASNGDDYGPVHAYYKYSTSQILYTKSDLDLAAGKKGTIKSIYFEYSGAAAMAARTIKIYMANTDLSSLTTSNYVPYASFTQVYSGTFSCGSAGWYEITLDTPFDYNGAGQLAVMIDDNTNSYQDDKNFKYHSATGKQIYKRQDSGDIDPASWTPSDAINSRPNTKFCIQEADMVQSTVTWVAGSNPSFSTQTNYAGTALTDPGTPDPGSYCPGGKVFVGWTGTAIPSETNTVPADLFTDVSGMTIPAQNKTYYAVWATATPTNDYKQITAEADLEAGKKYLIVGNSSTTYNALPVDAATSLTSLGSPSSSTFTTSTAAIIWTLEGSADAWKIKSTSNNKYIQISGGNLTFESSTSLTFSVSVSSSIFTFTSSAASGNKVLSYYHSQSKFNAYSSANTVYVYKQKITYTNYATTCCTPLGSVSGTLSSSTPTSATLTWSAVTGAEKYQVKVVGSSSHNDWTDAVSGVEVTGLTCNTAYTAYLRAIDTNGTNCSTGPESTVAIPAKSWTVTSTGVTNVTPASAIPSTTCDGFSIASMSPDAGYHLPANITVTNADHTWNSSTGALTISNVEGNVTITITGEQNSCTHYSFHWGTTKGSEDHVTCLNYVTGTTDTYRSALWTVPTTGGWTYVGWQGGWHNDNAKSANLGMTSIPYDKNHSKTLSRAEAGNVGGAQGYIQVYANSGDANKYVGFLPAGYIVRILNSSSVLQSTKTMVSKNGEVDDNNWHTSDIFELTSDIINGKYDVDLKTADGYVWAEGRSSTSNVAGMKIKNGNGTYRATNIVVGDAGTRGRFAIYADSGDDNWYCHFVPYHRIVFHANWPVSGSPADTYSVDVSVEETNSSIALASAPAAPTGYTFAGWYTAADGGTQRTGAQTISAGASADVELYAHWTANTYDITGSLTNVTCAALPTTYTYTGSAASESFTLVASTGYILPNSITVEMGSTTLTANTHYTYSSATGIVQITTTITDDIEITAAGVQADTYIDAIWNIVTAPKTGTYQRPTLSDQDPAGQNDCKHLHYHFAGWVIETYKNSPSGHLVPTSSVTANGTTYYAVWEKESAGGASSYTELTDVSVLAAGDNIIITNGSDAGMKAWNSSDNNCKEAAITISAGTITSIGDACELALGGSSGHWTFHDGT